ncbi:low specificity L-threonine aldolase [Oceanicola sp. 502str15]|uniref:threonine aldolase family protein n=1 Tax=Oceanicola sp. 502str15 TaxID=2696061 RepID=UPI002095E2F8|nr:beta-eliminating lyase-related protein [Oceanicola sp. 502str15]MCO6383580.1 low specificity L-threonine aldolase [Oceanicola sp. 502str15]
MNFASDNTGPVHPAVMAALVEANDGYAMPYGADPLSLRVVEQVREAFEAPEAAVFLAATGTAANVLLLSTMAEPFETIFCADCAHIHEDECNAPELFTGGAKLTLVPHEAGRMAPGDLRAAIEAEGTRGVHGPRRGPVSITQATEKGAVYTLEELRALSGVARDHGLGVHMDGARFANAVAHLGCTPAEASWKAGVDALSFGGTKNGLMGVEAMVLFDPTKAEELEYRRKRGAQLFSKHRYLAAQMGAYLTGGLWLESARTANAAAAALARGVEGAGGRLHAPQESNLLFADLPRAAHQRLKAAGASYYLMAGTLEGDDPDEMLTARLVCDWSVTEAEIARFCELAAG